MTFVYLSIHADVRVGMCVCGCVCVQGFESLALKRLQRLHYLEAQIKQYRYNIHKPLALALKPSLPGRLPSR